MDNSLTQLGVGAILAITVIRMVLDFLGKKKNGHSSGSLDPADWEQRIGIITKREMHDVLASRNEELRRMFREEAQIMMRRK